MQTQEKDALSAIPGAGSNCDDQQEIAGATLAPAQATPWRAMRIALSALLMAAVPWVGQAGAPLRACSETQSVPVTPQGETARVLGRVEHSLSRVRERLVERVEVACERLCGPSAIDHCREYAPVVLQSALDSGVDPLVVVAVIKVESDCDALAYTQGDGLGLMQVMPETALEVMKRMGIDGDSPEARVQSLFDYRVNIPVGTRYLGDLSRRYGGDVLTALVAYNRGPSGAAGYLRTRNAGSYFYVRRVQRWYRDLAGLGTGGLGKDYPG